MPRKKKTESSTDATASTRAPKKTRARASTKKVTSGRKKTVSKKKREPMIAEGTYCFYLQGGSVLASLKELHEALNLMSEDQFKYHTDGRNDFASWVDEVLGEAEAAAALRTAQMREEAARLLSAWL